MLRKFQSFCVNLIFNIILWKCAKIKFHSLSRLGMRFHSYLPTHASISNFISYINQQHLNFYVVNWNQYEKKSYEWIWYNAKIFPLRNINRMWYESKKSHFLWLWKTLNIQHVGKDSFIYSIYLMMWWIFFFKGYFYERIFIGFGSSWMFCGRN